jgi:type I restriction enzyme M protein
MDQATHNKIISFIWGIADDVLRDLFKRGKYADVILPMCVLRRLDAVLEPTKKAVLDTKVMLDGAGITEQRAALCAAAEQAFFNTSPFTLRDLKARASHQQLRSDFEAYLDGFSPNVQDILENFKFRNQIPTLAKADALGTLIEKFLDPDINLGPRPVLNGDRSVKHPAMDNHAMGTVFEELVRRFNEENNEEAGEHWTPRDAVKLMADLIFLPVADAIRSGSYMLYDGACGTGGMLTVAEERLQALAAAGKKQIKTHLFGQEINPETFAICKADMLLKGEGENADHIIGGAEWSTLFHDAYPARQFDFMLSNPPYGKSWKKDLGDMGGKDGMCDGRFKVMHQVEEVSLLGEAHGRDGRATGEFHGGGTGVSPVGEELSLVTRSSDGQLLFLVNMASKMNHKTALGSRIAEVHNGSSLFTGDAGQGESNIRRWLIENDWLEAVVALPLNMFYNTGIATYIWLLTNRKPEHRKGKVQLIDATQWFKPLRKNLGKKNCELSEDDIRRICAAHRQFTETEQSKIFPNQAFGYWKITVERPLRLHSQLTMKAVESLRFASGDEEIRSTLHDEFGDSLFTDFASLKPKLEKRLAEWGEDDEEDDEDAAPIRKGISEKKKKKLLDSKSWERDGRLVEVATALRDELGGDLFEDHNAFRTAVEAALKKLGHKLSAGDLKILYRAVSWRVETAPPVFAKVNKPGKAKADPLRGLFEAKVGGKLCVVEYEPDSDLRDTEQIPLLEPGGIEAFLRREVLPYTLDAWLNDGATKIGYEISFTRNFYRPQPLRTLEEIRADILTLEKETEGLLGEIVGGAKQ